MSEIESLPCLACAKGVQTSGGAAKMEWSSQTGIRPSSKESEACPHCGAAFERDVMPGAPWQPGDGGEAPAGL